MEELYRGDDGETVSPVFGVSNVSDEDITAVQLLYGAAVGSVPLPSEHL